MRGDATRVVVMALFTLGAVHSHAVTWSVSPRVSFGVQDYTHRLEDRLAPTSGSSFQFADGFETRDDLGFHGFGIGINADKVFVDVSGQWSAQGEEQQSQFQGVAGGLEFAAGIGITHQLSSEFERKEFNVSVGYRITPTVSAYIGYKNATADFVHALRPSDVGFFGAVKLTGDKVVENTYDGPFVGATYAIPVPAWGGAFAFQAAVVNLDMTDESRFLGTAEAQVGPTTFVPLDSSAFSSSIDGDAVGINVGFSWTGGFRWVDRSFTRLTYTIGIDHSEYEFEAGDSEFEEKNTRLRLDLRYRLGGP